MLRSDPYGDGSRFVIVAVGVLVALAGLATAGAFLADPTDRTPEPVPYDDTVELGLSSETDEIMAGTATIPRTQVFYSQLQYVVGYNGVETFVRTLDDGRTERQFGYPLAVYVETFDGASPGVTETGLFSAEGLADWTPADEAVYVVGSEARTPAGETAVPFADRDAADAFAAEHGGEVLGWDALRTRSFDVDTAATVRSMAPQRWDAADARIEATQGALDRPVSVTVGDDEPTIQAAVDAAPANTTVVVPPGTYEERIEVTEPVTIAGEGAHVSGGGNGSVLTVRAPNVAVTGLAISGTGNQTRDEDAVDEPPEDEGAWDTNIQLGYGHGDAGIRAIDAPGLFIDDVTIETDASGVILREDSDAVLRGLSVDGTEHWRDGFMGVVAIGSTVTVTDSAFDGGRDGVYLHRADGSVVRDATFEGNRYGVHLMYTADALVADTVIRDAEFGGITVMTRPEGNAIVGNDVRDSRAGIEASGTRTYVGYNTVVNNELGFTTAARQSLYEHNVAANNDVGARATAIVPSSRVARNDFVGNERPASANVGALRIWADGTEGNYWEGADSTIRAPGDRAYRPTSPVDGSFHHHPASVAVAESPAAVLLDRLLGTVPGSRSGSIVDPVPSAAPHAPDRVGAIADPDGKLLRADWRSALDPTGVSAESTTRDAKTASDPDVDRATYGESAPDVDRATDGESGPDVDRATDGLSGPDVDRATYGESVPTTPAMTVEGANPRTTSSGIPRSQTATDEPPDRLVPPSGVADS